VTATVDDIFDLFRAYGDHDYLGEPISLSEHMLQTAHAAELDGAPPPIVAAALLHDIGHLLHELPHDSADHGIDTIHEQVGARWLATRFSPDVSEPVRLHVAAKRYLCATDAAYFSILSPASVLSLNRRAARSRQPKPPPSPPTHTAMQPSASAVGTTSASSPTTAPQPSTTSVPPSSLWLVERAVIRLQRRARVGIQEAEPLARS
jgi:predicted HD phosphohydrolase